MLARICQTASGKSPFALSWTHYALHLTIKGPYEWSTLETR